MSNFKDANNHLNIVIVTNAIPILENVFSTIVTTVFEKFFKDFFDVRTSLNYPFETGGYSGALILGESHVNWHSFPEDRTLKIDIYSCKDIENKIDDILEGLSEIFTPTSVHYHFSKGFNNVYNKFG